MTAKARVLFVDDEKRVLNSMRGLFRRDFELFLTTEGSAAVKIAAESKIDVIVADQRMPGMTGIEVLGKVRQLSPGTVRILLTGYANQNAVQGSINIGEVFRFLSKPCPPQLLRETLDLAVNAARANLPPEDVKPTEPPVLRPILRTPSRTRQVDAVTARPSATLPSLQPARTDNEASSSHWQTITDVVMSGDTARESHPQEVGDHTIAMTKDVGVVVFTIDPSFAETAIRAVSADRDTTLATTLARVAHAIEERHAGVLVTDFTNKSAVLQKIVGVLKQNLPELVTIVVSGSGDTTDMITLINYGQIFRYIMKPIDSQSLRNDINAAAIKHMQLLHNPQLAKRHQVRNRVDEPDSSPTVNEFVGRIQNIQPRRFNGADNSS